MEIGSIVRVKIGCHFVDAGFYGWIGIVVEYESSPFYSDMMKIRLFTNRHITQTIRVIDAEEI